MEKEIRHIETVAEYNASLGVGTVHPLVSVINLAEAKRMRHRRYTFGFYVLYLKEVKCGDLIYGRRYYDYQEGTVVCMAPGQVAGIDDTDEMFQPRGWALCFHPELIYGTSLATRIKEYSYFSYDVNEALHLSQQEREIFVDCLNKISHELSHGADRLSRRLISANIGLLLDYCLRFYERQFVTRRIVNRDLLARFDSLIDTYLAGGRALTDGLPSVRWCAEELCLSPNYFGDLIRKETGRTPKKHIQHKVIDTAKERLLNTKKSISQISCELGFQYPQHFTRMFKNIVGITPNEFRDPSLVAVGRDT